MSVPGPDLVRPPVTVLVAEANAPVICVTPVPANVNPAWFAEPMTVLGPIASVVADVVLRLVTVGAVPVNTRLPAATLARLIVSGPVTWVPTVMVVRPLRVTPLPDVMV
jgi:hypothetical protein